jgi:hypothetical protein
VCRWEYDSYFVSHLTVEVHYDRDRQQTIPGPDRG